MRDTAESFNLLRLVLCTQPRSNPIAFGAVSKCAPWPELGQIQLLPVRLNGTRRRKSTGGRFAAYSHIGRNIKSLLWMPENNVKPDTLRAAHNIR